VLKIKHNAVVRALQGTAGQRLHREGIDFKEIYAFMARLESIHILLALSTMYETVLRFQQLDVIMAYMYGKFDE